MNELVKQETIEQLDALAQKGTEAMECTNRMQQAFTVSQVIMQMKEILTPQVMAPVMALMNSQIGFKTDKDGKQGKPLYSMEIVKDCFIQALMYGVMPTGNQFNIISSNTYITREGYGYLLQKIQGLKYSITPQIPKTVNNGAVIKMVLDWTFKGETSTKEIDLCIKVNSFMGSDGIIGKATRKARKFLYELITNNTTLDGDVESMNDMEPVEKNVTPKEETKQINTTDAILNKVKKPQTSIQKDDGFISPQDQKTLFNVLSQNNKSTGSLKVYLHEKYNIDSTSKIPRDELSNVLEWLNKKEVKQETENIFD